MNVELSDEHRLAGFAESLACPVDQSDLRTDGAAFLCTRGHRFPIEDDIVRCLDSVELTAAQREEMVVRDVAADTYDARFSRTRIAMELVPCMANLRPKPSDVVIDLGCGTGRFTKVFAPHVARVVAIDFSLASLQQLRRSLPIDLRSRVLLVQASITALPLKAACADKVVSLQVLEHLPTAQMRDDAMREARRILTAAGTFTGTVYNWSLYKRWLAHRGIGDDARKEGAHGGKIYYYNFERHDVTSMLERAHFAVDRVIGLQMHAPGFDLLGPLTTTVDAILSRTPLGVQLGHLLLVQGHVA